MSESRQPKAPPEGQTRSHGVGLRAVLPRCRQPRPAVRRLVLHLLSWTHWHLLPSDLSGRHPPTPDNVPSTRGPPPPSGPASGPAGGAGRTPGPGRRSGTCAADMVARAMRHRRRRRRPRGRARPGRPARVHRAAIPPPARPNSGPGRWRWPGPSGRPVHQIETTDLAMAEVAFAAGFDSVRQFNDTVPEVAPARRSELRARRGHEPSTGGTGGGGRCASRSAAPWLAGDTLLRFLSRPGPVPGVEVLGDGATYSRTLRLPRAARLGGIADGGGRARRR